MGKGTDKELNRLEKKPRVSKGADSDISKHLAETAWRVALPFIVLSIGGIKLDEYLDTSPLFTVIGVFAALFAVAVIVYRYVKKYYPETFKGIK